MEEDHWRKRADVHAAAAAAARPAEVPHTLGHQLRPTARASAAAAAVQPEQTKRHNDLREQMYLHQEKMKAVRETMVGNHKLGDLLHGIA